MWYQLFSSIMTKYGYEICEDEPCLFFKITQDQFSLVGVIVDDLLMASKPASVNDDLIAELKKHFGVKDLGEPRFLLGMHVERHSAHHITISQSLHIKNMASKYKLSGTSPHTPMTKDNPPSNADDPNVPDCAFRTKEYRSLLGSLLYCTLTRPDVSVCLGDLARIKNPKPRHMKQLRRVGEYLLGTQDMCLQLKPTKAVPGAELVAWADASFDTCPDSSRSRSGVYVTFAGCPIVWLSPWQRFVALSVAEAEFAALNRVAREVVWLRRILNDIGFPQQQPTPVYCDNNAAITLAGNNIATRPKTKHILRRFRYVREQQHLRHLKAVKVAGKENPADFFTKILGKRLFLKGRDLFLR